MMILGILLLLGSILDIIFTGFAIINILFIVSGVFLMVIEFMIKKTSFSKLQGVNKILSNIIILLVALVIIIIPLSFVNGKGSYRKLNSVLKKSSELINEGNLEKAYKVLDSYEYKDTTPEIMQNKAVILIRQEKYIDAENEINNAAAYKPHDANMLLNLGVCSFELANEEEARIRFEQVLLADPKKAQAYYYLGEIYFDKKQYTEACYFFDKAIDLSSDNPIYYYRYAELCLKIMDYKKGMVLVQTVLEQEITDELKKNLDKLISEFSYYSEIVE